MKTTKLPFLLVLVLVLLVSHVLPLLAQYPQQILPQYPKAWNSHWITHPGIEKTTYNHILFRNVFEIKAMPGQFIVHVSGDNRYRLYVNGEEVCYGPQLGDMRHWRYETLDLAPFFRPGKNVVAAEVMNWGSERAYGIMSFNTGFLLQGQSKAETFLNTGYNSQWKVYRDSGMHEKTVHWRGGNQIVGGFYASNPTDSVVAAPISLGLAAIRL